MIFNQSFKIERFITGLSWDIIPADVREQVLICATDLFGALILGSYGEQCQAGVNIANLCNLTGSIPILGGSHIDNCAEYNLLGASIIYGHQSNSFDIDDGNRQICGHPGASFIGGVLAAALQNNIGYKHFLSTLVACYEVTVRWAIAMQKHYGYLHSTGAYGSFGTAAGIGKIMNLSLQQLNNALSIADFHAPMTPVMRAVEYPSMNKDGVPFGSLTGCMAVLETLCGSTGKTHLLENPDFQYLTEDLGQRYYIKELYFKPYTCCRWAHQPIRACIDMKKRYGFEHTDIEAVTVHTFDSASKLSKVKPKDTDEAQYNIAYPVATAIVNGDVGFNQIRNKALSDSSVLSMMDRLSFVVDPELDSLFPAKRLGWVEIFLNDGTCIKSDIYEAEGEPDDVNLGPDWIHNKFKRITGPMINPEGQERILSCISAASDIKMNDIVRTVCDSLIPVI